MLWRTNELLLLLAAVVALLSVVEIGYRVGARHLHRTDEAAKTHLGALQAALLGLLALLLGFTFAMTVSRFDTRKALVLEEANVIGTTYLRSKLLPPPHSDEAARLLRAYVVVRLDFYRAGIDDVRLAAADAAASRIQEQIWTLARAVAARDQRPFPRDCSSSPSTR